MILQTARSGLFAVKLEAAAPPIELQRHMAILIPSVFKEFSALFAARRCESSRPPPARNARNGAYDGGARWATEPPWLPLRTLPFDTHIIQRDEGR